DRYQIVRSPVDISGPALSGSEPSEGLQQLRSENVAVLSDQQNNDPAAWRRHIPSDVFGGQLPAARATRRRPPAADRHSKSFVPGSVRRRHRFDDSSLASRDGQRPGGY